jgi:hypothetical protein
VYEQLAIEVNSWTTPDPTIPAEHQQQHLDDITRKKYITLEHAKLYHQIMQIFRCEVKNVPIYPLFVEW